MSEDYMCENCVTPWKCNGPHTDPTVPTTPQHPTTVLTENTLIERLCSGAVALRNYDKPHAARVTIRAALLRKVAGDADEAAGTILGLTEVLRDVARVNEYADGRTELCWCHHEPHGGPRDTNDHERHCLDASALLSEQSEDVKGATPNTSDEKESE